jgi:hypothetical protein
MLTTNDPEIRAALHKKKIEQHRRNPNTIVVDELGLLHAKARVDVAVINGCIHGFEIKSGVDKLDRLARQMELYASCLEKLTIVCAGNHVAEVLPILPDWCGLLLARKGRRGGIDFLTMRKAVRNPFVDKSKLAHLLWRPEVIRLLECIDAPKAVLKRPRVEMYDYVAAQLTLSEITAYVRECLINRETWRRPPALASRGG